MGWGPSAGSFVPGRGRHGHIGPTSGSEGSKALKTLKQTAWVQFLTQPITGCVTLGKSLDSLEFEFLPHKM